MTIALVGERNANNVTHAPTEAAFEQLAVDAEWVATGAIAQDSSVLDGYSGIMLPPAMPYESEDGALASIRYARESDVPLLATCGGFQYVVIELVRNRLGVAGASHGETHPDADELAVVPLSCSLFGEEHPVRVDRESRAGALYGLEESVEPFFCSFGLNPMYREELEFEGVRFTGFDREGEPRILELPRNRFFLATLFVPQARKSPSPHPLIAGFANRSHYRDHSHSRQLTP